jgi:putative ABC transport system substrate-binding protein
VDAHASIADGFIAKMAELGYLQGRNVVYHQQRLNADPAGNESVCREFVTQGVDLILAFPTSPALAAQQAARGRGIPVVFAYSTIEGTELVASTREPGRNTTGVRYPGPDLTAKRLEIFCELAPRLERLWVAYDREYSTSKNAVEVLRRAAAARRVTLVEVPATRVEDIARDLNARSLLADPGVDGLFIMPEWHSQSPQGWAAIKAFASRHRIPIGGSSSTQARDGAVFSYAPDYLENGEAAAVLAHKILQGTPAGSIPVVTPECSLRLNYKAARELGLTIPGGLLKQAAEIIR